MHEIDDEAVVCWAEHFAANLDGKEHMFRIANHMPKEKRLETQRMLVRGMLEELLPSTRYSVHRFDDMQATAQQHVIEETDQEADDRALRRTQQELGTISEATWQRCAHQAGVADVAQFKHETWQKVFQKHRMNG